MTETMYNTVKDYEDGKLTQQEIREMYRELIESGMVWGMSGVYQRIAEMMISNGVIVCHREGGKLVCVLSS